MSARHAYVGIMMHSIPCPFCIMTVSRLQMALGFASVESTKMYSLDTSPSKWLAARPRLSVKLRVESSDTVDESTMTSSETCRGPM